MRTLLHILGIRQDPAQPERPRGGQGGGGGKVDREFSPCLQSRCSCACL